MHFEQVELTTNRSNPLTAILWRQEHNKNAVRIKSRGGNLLPQLTFFEIEKFRARCQTAQPLRSIHCAI